MSELFRRCTAVIVDVFAVDESNINVASIVNVVVVVVVVEVAFFSTLDSEFRIDVDVVVVTSVGG